MLTGIAPEKHPPSLPYRPPAVYAEKTGPLEGMFKYGKQGGIEYKPNWGQPISETGEWLSQQEAQPASFDVGKVLTQQKDTLKQQFRQREKQLRSYGLSQPLLNKALDKMQQEWDEHMLKIMGTQSQLDLINQSVASGEIDPITAKEAQARLVLPAGVVDTLFPTPKAGPQPSIAGTTPSTYEDLTEQFASMKDSVMVNPPGRGFWAQNVVDPEKLKALYQNVREIGNYNESRNIGKVAGLNHSFINTVSGWHGGKEALVQLLNENPNWFGPQSRLIQAFNKKTSGKQMTPLAKSVATKPFKGASAGMTYPYTPKGTQPQTKENDPLGLR
jgi:hypothetical protein